MMFPNSKPYPDITLGSHHGIHRAYSNMPCKPDHGLEPERLTLIDRDIESVVVEGHVTDVHHEPYSRPFRIFVFLCLSDAGKRGHIAFPADYDSLYSSARSR